MEKPTNKLTKSRSAGYLRRASTTVDVAPFSVANFSPSEVNYIYSVCICLYSMFYSMRILRSLDLKSNMPVDTDDAIHAIHRSLQSSTECTVHELGKTFIAITLNM